MKKKTTYEEQHTSTETNECVKKDILLSLRKMTKMRRLESLLVLLSA
jgi:hypothetical protein